MARKWKAGLLTAALILSNMPNVYAGPKDEREDLHAVVFGNAQGSEIRANGSTPTSTEI